MTDRTERPDMGTTEVPEKARRRTFDRAYRLRIVEKADRCTEPGQIGELLRREGCTRRNCRIGVVNAQKAA